MSLELSIEHDLLAIGIQLEKLQVYMFSHNY